MLLLVDDRLTMMTYGRDVAYEPFNRLKGAVLIFISMPCDMALFYGYFTDTIRPTSTTTTAASAV